MVLNKQKKQYIILGVLAVLFMTFFLKTVVFKKKRSRGRGSGRVEDIAKKLPESLTARLPKTEDIEYPAYAYSAEEGRVPFDLPPELKNRIYTEELEAFSKPRRQERVTQEDASLPGIQISGVIWGGKSPTVIANGEIFKEGDSIEGAEILKVSKDGMWVIYEGKRFFVEINR